MDSQALGWPPRLSTAWRESGLPVPLCGVCNSQTQSVFLPCQQVHNRLRFTRALLRHPENCGYVFGLALCVWAPNIAPAQGNQPLREDLQETLFLQAWEEVLSMQCGEPVWGRRGSEPACQFPRPLFEGMCLLLLRGSSELSTRPNIAASWPRFCSAPSDLTKTFLASSIAAQEGRLLEFGRHDWHLTELSSTLAFPFDLGPRPTWIWVESGCFKLPRAQQ